MRCGRKTLDYKAMYVILFNKRKEGSHGIL